MIHTSFSPQNAPQPASKLNHRTGESDAVGSPVPSEALLRGHKTVAIAHNGMLYTLQATKMGKLILTK
jgi:hemin uptake protein HemP